MRQCKYKRCFDPEMGQYVRKHIYGEGMFDVMKTVFDKTVKDTAKTVAKSALSKAATETGEYTGNKVGDKIIDLLREKNKKTKQ